MPELFSDEWIDVLDALARGDDELRAAAAEIDVVIQQTVVATDGARSYHVVLTPDDVGVRPGPAPAPTITFTADHETAAAIANGDESAQTAFIDGRLRLGGDLRKLLEAQSAVARLGDTFSAARTDPEPDAVTT